MSLSRLANALAKGEVSPSQVVEAYLDALELHQDLNIYLSVRAEEAMADARALEKAGPRGALWGVPVGIKDIIDVAGAPTTAASKILASNVATTDATVVAGLKAAGAIILGKVNTHEFAYGAKGSQCSPVRSDCNRLGSGHSSSPCTARRLFRPFVSPHPRIRRPQCATSRGQRRYHPWTPRSRREPHSRAKNGRRPPRTRHPIPRS